MLFTKWASGIFLRAYLILVHGFPWYWLAHPPMHTELRHRLYYTLCTFGMINNNGVLLSRVESLIDGRKYTVYTIFNASWKRGQLQSEVSVSTRWNYRTPAFLICLIAVENSILYYIILIKNKFMSRLRRAALHAQRTPIDYVYSVYTIYVHFTNRNS